MRGERDRLFEVEETEEVVERVGEEEEEILDNGEESEKKEEAIDEREEVGEGELLYERSREEKS